MLSVCFSFSFDSYKIFKQTKGEVIDVKSSEKELAELHDFSPNILISKTMTKSAK